LISWYKNFTNSPPLVLVHGEDQAQEVLAEKIKSETTAEVTIAKRGQKLDMLKL
jgi:metallo-beta-lactamase family protein